MSNQCRWLHRWGAWMALQNIAVKDDDTTLRIIGFAQSRKCVRCGKIEMRQVYGQRL